MPKTPILPKGIFEAKIKDYGFKDKFDKTGIELIVYFAAKYQDAFVEIKWRVDPQNVERRAKLEKGLQTMGFDFTRSFSDLSMGRASKLLNTDMIYYLTVDHFTNATNDVYAYIKYVSRIHPDQKKEQMKPAQSQLNQSPQVEDDIRF